MHTGQPGSGGTSTSYSNRCASDGPEAAALGRGALAAAAALALSASAGAASGWDCASGPAWVACLAACPCPTTVPEHAHDAAGLGNAWP